MRITKTQLQQIIKEETQALMNEKSLIGKAMGAIGKKAKAAATSAVAGAKDAVAKKAKSAVTNAKDQAIAKQAVNFLKDKPELAKLVIDALSKSIEAGAKGTKA